MTLASLAAALLAGCADEDPVGLDPLVPPGAVRTYEVVLDAAQFLVQDTAIVGFSTAAATDQGIVAEDHEGVLDAHTLVRFALPLSSITYTDTAGSTKIDNSPILVSGGVVARLDTLQAPRDEPVTLALYTIAEAWDEGTADWTFRVDTGGVAEPWAEPGGTRGTLVSTAQLAADADSLIFDVDSATLALWSDTTNQARGALIVAQTPGARLRFADFDLVLQARPSARPDTLVADTVGWNRLTYVYDPAPAHDGSLLVGGTPAWRSYLQFRTGLDTVAVDVPCTGGEACSLRLGDVAINYAGLQLQPLRSPAGFAPDDTVRITFHQVLGGGQVPLARAPLSGEISGALLTVPRSAFDGGGAPVEVGLTGTLRAIVAAAARAGDDELPITLALLDRDHVIRSGGDTFGIAAFAPARAGIAAPKLRLIISVVNEDQLR
ncbi:MAG TPA: hypothetical protein VF158_00170 [Longimicrobiales bacterium]